MLGRKDYRPEEVARAKKSIAAQLAAYKKLANAVADTGDARSQAALEAFAPPLFEQLLLALDRPFVHRLRMTAGKDGNPLNELELLCESVLNNAGRFRGNNVIQYHAAGSVLGLEPGDPIRLSAADFERLSKAFFRELEARFL